MADRDDIERRSTKEDPSDDGGPDAERDTEHDIVRRHLTRAWQSWAPGPDLDARVRARLTSSSAAMMGAFGIVASGTVRPSPWASLQASGKVGALVGAGLLGLGFLSGYLAHSNDRGLQRGAPLPPTTSPALGTLVQHDPDRAPEVSGASEAQRAPSAAPEIEPSSARRRASPPASSSPRAGTSPRPASDANQELALLQRAERAVRSDNAALALALIDELEARYPRSTLLEERGAIELLAHCGAGATDANSRADRFLRRHPQSLYAGRIRELCAIENANAETMTKPSSAGHGSEQKEPR